MGLSQSQTSQSAADIAYQIQTTAQQLHQNIGNQKKAQDSLKQLQHLCSKLESSLTGATSNNNQIHPVFYQDRTTDFPDFNYLRSYGIALQEIDEESVSQCTSSVLFYLVHHTARFATVNLKQDTLDRIKLAFKGRVVVIALTPGRSDIAGPAPKQTSTGESVVTFWYQHGKFIDADNEPGYKFIRSLLAQ